MTIAIIVMACLIPIMSITSFVIGYNINAPKKIFKLPQKKAEPTADEIMLDRIDKATV